MEALRDARSIPTSAENLVLRFEPLPRALQDAAAVCIPQIGLAQSIELARCRTCDGRSRRVHTRRLSIVIALPRESPPPGGFSLDRFGTRPWTARWRRDLALLHMTRGTPSRRVNTRHRFRRRSRARHHPSARDTSIPLPCRVRGLRPRSSYLRHSPGVRGFKYLADHGQAPGTTPVPTHLPRLGVTFRSHVTSLEGCRPRALHSTSRAPARSQLPKSVAPTSLSGGRTQKLHPYPSVQALRRSAPSHDFVTSKGLRPSHG